VDLYKGREETYNSLGAGYGEGALEGQLFPCHPAGAAHVVQALKEEDWRLHAV